MSKDLVVAIYGAYPGDWVRSGALWGGSASPGASTPRYWLPLRLEHEPHALFEARKVPDAIAKRIEDHGTSDQYYDDGYKGLHAIAPYLDKEPFYESPEAWIKEKDREQRREAGEDEEEAPSTRRSARHGDVSGSRSNTFVYKQYVVNLAHNSRGTRFRMRRGSGMGAHSASGLLPKTALSDATVLVKRMIDAKRSSRKSSRSR